MSEQEERLCLYDFDGTLTRKDTLIEFIRFVKGDAGLLWGVVRLSPLLILMKLHLYDNGKAKQKLFSFCFKGMDIDRFDVLCQEFAKKNWKRLLRPMGIESIDRDLSRGARVMVVSASIDNWVRPFFQGNMKPEIVGTQIGTADGVLTGRFLTPNCYGPEKVRRVKALLKHPRSHYFITAYGDSNGDRDMLDLADEAHYKPFR